MMKYQIPKDIPLSIFRTYDIRGIVDETLTNDMVYALGLAIGSKIKNENGHEVLIARDGRLSSGSFSQALCTGLLESGCDVIDLGIVPTPVLYFATFTFSTNSGVMITGSHNPSNHNGLKIVVSGRTLSENEIYQLHTCICEKKFTKGSGEYTQIEILPNYTNKIKNDIRIKKPLQLVIDCGNGVTSVIASKLFENLGCKITTLYCELDGTFPNHFPDPSKPENLQDLINTVIKTKADLGLAFDGDGDRLAVITNKGEIIWPDRVLMLLASEILKTNSGATILYDVKCTIYLEKIIQDHGGKPLMYKTGHSLIKSKLQEIKAPLAGEMSGHFFYNDSRWFGFDDGIYTAARLLEILSDSNKSSSEIFHALPNSFNTPELNIMISDERKFEFMKKFKKESSFPNAKLITIDGLRVEFDFGWGLIRPSNTTACLVLRFEADTLANLKRIQSIFREQILLIDKNLIVPF
ncbi:MAG: phosphomannomutase/phosphoglucomutase [Gammaproteobacteria bacterium]